VVVVGVAVGFGRYWLTARRRVAVNFCVAHTTARSVN
jgi:hypothetical protein